MPTVARYELMRGFVNEEKQLFKKLTHYLKEEKCLNIEVYNSIPMNGSAYVNGEEGIWFNLYQSDYLDNRQKVDIRAAFPINIEGYEIKLLEISDFEIEFGNDRYWNPSFTMGFYKEDRNVLSL